MSEATEVRSPQILEIRASSGWQAIDLREVWRFRELLAIFTWRDVKVRYSQTFLGAIWVWGQPLLSMIIFTFVFNRVAKISSGSSVPYPLFVMVGLLPWNFFSSGVLASGNSLIGSSGLISKVYFPRLIVPISSIAVAFFDFLVTSVILAALMVWYRVAPGPSFLLLPIVLAAAASLALGLGFLCSALNVEYRDVRVVIPFILQLWMYATPVVYPVTALPAAYRKLAIWNPLTGVVLGFRACILNEPMPWNALGVSFGAGAVLFLAGAFYFRRMERQFADVI